MHITLVNPHTLIQPDDPLTTGIYYFPITLASLAATLRKQSHTVQVVDAFGEAPETIVSWKRWWIQGLPVSQVLAKIDEHPDGPIFIYAANLVSHEATLQLVEAISARHPKRPRIVLENTQAVTAYALKNVLPEFFKAGATHVLTGECEERAGRLLNALANPDEMKKLDGVYWQENGTTHGAEPGLPIADLDALPFPAWDLFPLKKYWKLRYAHGPVTESRWLPLMTSRGCPYPCHFCVVPATNQMRWRMRSPANVVQEMQLWNERLGITEFHIEDLNPTVDEGRIRGLCEAIESAGLKITWKIVAGTKLDILKDLDTLRRMSRAGCRYISFSPESGSPDVLKKMGKPFRHDAAVEMTALMNREGIRSQACFVVGYPGETDRDRELTRSYIKRLVKAGLDEIALFICTPAPGSSIYGDEQGYQSLSDLSFSPAWRQTFPYLSRYRLGTYMRFMFWKLIHQPQKLLQQPLHFLRRRFQTKMEMSPYRALSVTYRRWAHASAKS